MMIQLATTCPEFKLLLLLLNAERAASLSYRSG